MQGRIGNRDKRHGDLRRFTQRKCHPTRQMHGQLFALLHGLQQFHRQETLLGFRGQIPPADVLALHQFHQVIARHFHAKRAAIGLTKAEIQPPCDVQAVLADVDDSQRRGGQRLIDGSRRNPRTPGDFESAPFAQRGIHRLPVLRGRLAQHRAAHVAPHVGLGLGDRHFHGRCLGIGNGRTGQPRTTLTDDGHANVQFQTMTSFALDQQR